MKVSDGVSSIGARDVRFIQQQQKKMRVVIDEKEKPNWEIGTEMKVKMMW